MFRTTKSWNWVLAAQNLMLASAGAATATFTLVGAKLQCFKTAPVAAGRNQTLVSLEESTFTGYAEKTLAAIGAVTTPLQGPLLLNSQQTGLNCSVMFACSVAPDAPGETINGVALLNPAGTDLWGYEIFAEPVPIVAAGDFLQHDLVLPLNTTVMIP